jgi:hypothetical protein
MYHFDGGIVKHNQTILKVYGYGDSKKIKVVTLNAVNVLGNVNNIKKSSERGVVNSEKLSENISRAKSTIFELAFCNSWDWFFTCTLNPAKYDRTDLDMFHRRLTQWLRDYSKKHGLNIKFLLVPELHKDGKSWHMHGFLKGLPVEHLEQFRVGDSMGKGLADKVKKGDVVYNWVAYANKFGFCDLEPIGCHEAVSKYITKYINKGLASSVTDLNAHLYYVSRGLKRAEVVKQGILFGDVEYSYENEYCKVAWLDYSDELLVKLKNAVI